MKVPGILISVLLLAISMPVPSAATDTEGAHETFIKYCTKCHLPNRSLRAVKSEENWKLTVERMNFQYKMFYDEDIPLPAREVILQYLLKEAGKE